MKTLCPIFFVWNAVANDDAAQFSLEAPRTSVRETLVATPAMTADARREWAQPRTILLGGLLLTLLAYLNTLTFQFVYDDHQLKGPGGYLDAGVIASYFTHHLWAGIAQHGGYYRPVLQTWVVLVHFFLGQNVVAWHVTAIAMHLLVTWLVYLAVADIARDRLLAAVTAGIFGVHPVHVEVVAWISGAMSEGLLAALTLGSLVCYMRARREREHPLRWHATSWLLFAAALLVKETAAALPIVIAAYEWIRPAEDKAHRSRTILNAGALAAPYGVVFVAYFFVRHMVLSGVAAMPSDPGAIAAPMWQTLPSAAWFYLRELAWPRLSIFQPVVPVATADFGSFWLPLAGVVVVAVALIVIARRSALAAFAASFLAAMLLVPVLAVYALPKYELVHDRYLYLPSVGLALLLAVGVRQLATKMARPAIVLLLVGVVVTIVTAAENNDWTNDFTLFRHAAAAAPNNPMPLNLLANEMFKQGHAGEALHLYRRALEIDPELWATNFSLGVTECGLGLFPPCDQHLSAAARLDPQSSVQFLYLGQARIELENYGGAEDALLKGIALAPSSPGFHYLLGVAQLREGKLAAAKGSAQAELNINPGSAEARSLLGDLEKQMGPGASAHP